MIIKKITKDKLKRYLSKVGWTLRDVRQDFCYLVDRKGNKTNLWLHSVRISVEEDNPISIEFGFRDSILKYDKKNHFVCISSHNNNPSIFLSFYDRRENKETI